MQRKACFLVLGKVCGSSNLSNGTTVWWSHVMLNGSRKVLTLMAPAIFKRSEVWQVILALQEGGAA